MQIIDIIFLFLFKNIKDNIKNNIFLFTGIAINIAFLFFFLFLKASIDRMSDIHETIRYESLDYSVKNFVMLIFVSALFMMMYTIVPYIRARFREYGLLLILGIRKRMLFFILCVEYLVMWGITFLLGIGLGIFLSCCLYYFFTYTEYPMVEIHWLAAARESGIITFRFSVIMVVCAVIYILFILKNKNLSVFQYEASIPDGIKSVRKSIWLGIGGVFLVILSVTVRFWYSFIGSMGIQPDADLLVQITSIGGMYLLVSFGVPTALRYMGRTKHAHTKNLLAIRSMGFKLSAYKNTVFAVLLIHFAILFYLSNNIRGIYPLAGNEFGWRYPHDIVAMTNREQAEKWEQVSNSEYGSGTMRSIPYVELQPLSGRNYIGISTEEYNSLCSADVKLEKNQIYICQQRYTGDLNWDYAENYMEFQIGEAINKYDIEGIDAKNLTWAFPGFEILVLSDEEFTELLSKGLTANVLIIQDVNKNKQTAVLEQLQNFREENPGGKWIVRPEALIMEKMAHKMFNVINIFVGLCLVIVGISMISTKLYIDVPYMQKKYEFYWDIGMKSKRMRQELRKETLMIIWIPAFFAMLMAGGYEAELLFRFLWIKGSISALAKKEAILEVCQLAGSWLGIAAVFVLINFVYGECILGALRRRVLPNKKER